MRISNNMPLLSRTFRKLTAHLKATPGFDFLPDRSGALRQVNKLTMASLYITAAKVAVFSCFFIIVTESSIIFSLYSTGL